jgi:nucleoid DNA-binding protein
MWFDFFESVVDELHRGRAAHVSFGTFFLHWAKMYLGRNPATGSQIVIPPRTHVRFLPEAGWLAEVFAPSAERWSAEDYLAELVYDDTGEPIPIPDATALPAPSALVDELTTALRRDGRWRSSGFGKFLVRSARPPSRPTESRVAAVRFSASIVLQTMSWQR